MPKEIEAVQLPRIFANDRAKKLELARLGKIPQKPAAASTGFAFRRC
jgi:hypothetical protein